MKGTVILSIRPEYVDKIFNGTKKYELRRKIWKRTDIERVLVYQTAPLSRVVGEFEIERVLYDKVDALYDLKGLSGINGIDFYVYFKDLVKGYAIKIKNPKIYIRPISLNSLGYVAPPQNFMYFDESPDLLKGTDNG